MVFPAGAKACTCRAGSPSRGWLAASAPIIYRTSAHQIPINFFLTNLPSPFPQRLAIQVPSTTIAIMAARGVSLLKFVGTVSLGLLTVCCSFYLSPSRTSPRFIHQRCSPACLQQLSSHPRLFHRRTRCLVSLIVFYLLDASTTLETKIGA